MLRIIDFILSLVGLILLAPVFVLLAACILLEDGAPIFFLQVRVGQFGESFKIIKFRSMRVDTSGRNQGGIDDELGLEASNKLYMRTQANDPRVTLVGRILRKYHLDELPQLLNVAKGEMSLVGPRPDTPVQELEYRSSDWAKRCELKPGVTGLSQIFSGTLRFTPRRRVALDILYAKKMNACLYFWIIFMTARRVFIGRSN